MTIDQKLEILKRAMELGANVDVSFHRRKNRDEAGAIANELKLEFEEVGTEDVNWLKFNDNNEYQFEISIFYKKSKEERKKQLLAELEELEELEKVE